MEKKEKEEEREKLKKEKEEEKEKLKKEKLEEKERQKREKEMEKEEAAKKKQEEKVNIRQFFTLNLNFLLYFFLVFYPLGREGKTRKSQSRKTK